MQNPTIHGTPGSCLCLVTRLLLAALFFLVIPTMSKPQTPLQAKPAGAEPIPEPAVPAILAAFDKYEVVAMPESHGMEDEDHFIL
jgi:hypothetical protein